MIKRLFISLGLIVVLIAGGAGAARLLMTTKPKPAERVTVVKPPLVQVVTVSSETVTETLVGYGSARAFRSATLSAEVAGEVVEIGDGLEDGSQVTADQLLLRIDPRRYTQALEERQAAAAAEGSRLQQLTVEEQNFRRLLGIAEREVELNRDEERRLARLFENGNASKREYDAARLIYTRSMRERAVYQNQIDLLEPQRAQIQASLAGLRAGIEQARLDLEHCDIQAPFAGRIDELGVEIGEIAQRGTVLVTVVDPATIELPIELPASAYSRTRPGASVIVTSDTLPNMEWFGTVERISPDVNQQSRTFRAYVVVDNRQQFIPLVPGFFVKAEVAGPTLEGVLLVPRGAIVENGVFVINDQRVHHRPIKVERFLGDRAVVSGELESGETIAVTNLDVLAEDTPVRSDQAGGND